MSEINNDEIRSILLKLSKEIVLPKFKNLKDGEILYKNKKDLVTCVDIEVEKNLKKILISILPNSLFVGEELFYSNPKIINSYNENQFCWTVDPIDGTTNFVKGKDKFAIMIALSYKDIILQSWIYMPLTDEFYYSKLGEGSFVDGKKIYSAEDMVISDSIGSISSKYWDNKYNKRIFEIKYLFKETNSYGCIGIEYIDIAKGVRNFAILSKLSPWDHMAGILLVKEAGGSILHFDKSNYNHCLEKDNLVVTNSFILQDEIINLIKGDKNGN